MKAYRVELLIVDHDGIGCDGIIIAIENTKYPNRCIAPSVIEIDVAEIGVWSDDHPLNSFATQEDEFARLFPREPEQ